MHYNTQLRADILDGVRSQRSPREIAALTGFSVPYIYNVMAELVAAERLIKHAPNRYSVNDCDALRISQAIANRHKGLLLYRHGGHDDAALALLDAADAAWCAVRRVQS